MDVQLRSQQVVDSYGHSLPISPGGDEQGLRISPVSFLPLLRTVDTHLQISDVSGGKVATFMGQRTQQECNWSDLPLTTSLPWFLHLHRKCCYLDHRRTMRS